MSAAFTSGPWVWIEGTDAINHRWNNHDWTVASVGNHRLGWHEDKNSEGREAGANARLIAAAPELLAALQDVECLGLLPPNLLAKARAAIAKAIGPSA